MADFQLGTGTFSFKFRPNFISHIAETDGKFAGIGTGKQKSFIPTPHALETEFFPRFYKKTIVELVHNKTLVVRNWQEWLAPYGPSEISGHAAQLDFFLRVEDGKAVLRGRALTSGDLAWGDPVIILSQIPPGVPQVMEPEKMTTRQFKSFLGTMTKYLSEPQITEWEEYFQTMQTAEKPAPFLLQNLLPVVERKVVLPKSLTPENLKEMYSNVNNKPIKVCYSKVRN
jgi:hypothetical protein